MDRVPLLDIHKKKPFYERRRFQLTLVGALLTISIGFIVVLLIILQTRGNILKYDIQSSIEESPSWLKEAFEESGIKRIEGGLSLNLPQENVLWLFSNTTLNNSQSIANSALLLTFTNKKVIYSKFITNDQSIPRAIISLETGENISIRPTSGISVGDEVYLYWDANRQVCKGQQTFKNRDWFKTNVNFSMMNQEHLPLTVAHSLLSKDKKYIYHYIVRQSNQKDIVIARTKVEDMNQPGLPGNFWDGDDFSRNSLHSAESVISEWNAPSVSVGWNSYLSCYCLLSSRDSVIQMMTADDPWGPWNKPIDVFKLQDITGIITSAHFHPELWLEDGRIMYFSVTIDNEDYPFPLLAKLELSNRRGSKFILV